MNNSDGTVPKYIVNELDSHKLKEVHVKGTAKGSSKRVRSLRMFEVVFPKKKSQSVQLDEVSMAEQGILAVAPQVHEEFSDSITDVDIHDHKNYIGLARNEFVVSKVIPPFDYSKEVNNV